jgi:hypothetical protein
MEEMDTVTEIINKLRNDGYAEDFNLQQNCLQCLSGHVDITPRDFVIGLKATATRQMKQPFMPFPAPGTALKAYW